MQRLLDEINKLDKTAVYMQSKLDDAIKRKGQLENNIKLATELHDTYSKGSALFNAA